MKLSRIFLSLGVVAAMASSSYGAGNVWWTATATSPNAGVDSQGEGQALQLSCDKAQGACTWDIVVMYNNLDGGAGSWGLDMYSNDMPKFQVSNATVTATPLSNFSQNPGQLNGAGGAGFLVFNAGGSSSTAGGNPAGLYDLYHFTLTKGAGPNLGLHPIFAGFGAGEFGGNDPAGFDSYEVVALGPNAPVAGFNTGAPEPLPVIVVNNVPEPTTLSLLALGGLALIRRRK